MAGSRLVDLRGQRIGMLVVVERAGLVNTHATWLCRCDCGTEKIVSGPALRRGQKSCGCLIRTHNLSRSGTYKSWQMLLQRCGNARYSHYPNYGGRGIRVTARWDDFENFVADLGMRPPGTSLDRIDGRGNYEPGNCRWATRLEQNVNTRVSAGYRTLDGRRISMREMAEYLAAPVSLLRYHLRAKG